MGKKKVQNKKPIDWQGIIIHAIVDLIIGLILAIFNKYLG
jgi:hypothetical protein